MDGGDLTSPNAGPLQDCDGGAAAGQPPEVDGSGSIRPEGCDALARAISSTLGAVISEFDSSADGASRSQDELALALDRLTGELDKLLEDAPLPFIMQQSAKISSVRRRVSALNLLLKSIQGRIDNIDRILSPGMPVVSFTENIPPDVAGEQDH